MNDKIIKTIEDYISDENESALMINGVWGSGKTYFVKNVLSQKYSNIIYVSLYGINSTDLIDEKICNEIIKKNNPIVKKNKNQNQKNNPFGNLIFKIGKSALKNKLGVDLSEINKKDFVGIINQTTRLNEYILIFDDLERCSMDIQITLGHINDFVEHKKVKTIIIANEDEITNIPEDNIELKMLSVLNNNVDFPNKKNQTNNFFNNNSVDNKLSKEEINDRIDYLYSDLDKYKKVKEKIISNTLYFEPDLRSV